MRIQPISDLHLEFDPDKGERFAQTLPVLGDVLVLAGDIRPLRKETRIRETLGWFCARFPQVVYVAGNHEFYKTEPVSASALLAEVAEFPNLHVLDAAIVTIDGTRFVGATLWYPRTPDDEQYRQFLPDFTLIEGFVPWVHEAHARHLAFLEQNVRPGDVVVTHFLPHPRSVAPQYAESPLNRFYLAADTAALVERAGARLWIHGHTHVAFDYRVGDTRVLCNPRGYPGEPGTSVDPALIIEV